jgi:hypothetical protein
MENYYQDFNLYFAEEPILDEDEKIEWHLEIRRSDDGTPESTDTFVGTESEVYEDAEKWLTEALSLDSYQKEILIINKANENCLYQGTFDLVP